MIAWRRLQGRFSTKRPFRAELIRLVHVSQSRPILFAKPYGIRVQNIRAPSTLWLATTVYWLWRRTHVNRRVIHVL